MNRQNEARADNPEPNNKEVSASESKPRRTKGMTQWPEAHVGHFFATAGIGGKLILQHGGQVARRPTSTSFFANARFPKLRSIRGISCLSRAR